MPSSSAPSSASPPAAAGAARLQAGLLLAAVLAAYASAFGGSFQFDDFNVIVRQPAVHSLAAWWESMPGIRPLLKLAYTLSWSAGGGGTVAFHAVNVGLHAANVLLAWAILTALWCRMGVADVRMAASAGALLFALHPAHTEAVTYISGRSVVADGLLLPRQRPCLPAQRAALDVAGTWDDWLLASLRDFHRLLVVSPHHNHGNHVDMPFVSREWVDASGWFACPEFYHYCRPIVTGLIGEMTGIAHCPEGSFHIDHDYQDGTNMGIRKYDNARFFDYVSLKMPAVVEKIRGLM